MATELSSGRAEALKGKNDVGKPKSLQQVQGILMSPSQERRRHPRIALRWALSLSRPGQLNRVESVTENLSRAGFYCFLPQKLEIGEDVDCVLEIPTRDYGHPSGSLSLRCTAKVVRIESAEVNRFGVACRIDDYEIAV
jgi:hypothetical protein